MKIRSELNTIVNINQSILNSLKTQKVRAEQLLERYERELRQELNIPSNVYLTWHKIAGAYLEAVITNKLIEFEVSKRMEQYIKELLQYEANYVFMSGYVDNLEQGFDMLIENIKFMEKKLVNYNLISEKPIPQSIDYKEDVVEDNTPESLIEENKEEKTPEEKRIDDKEAKKIKNIMDKMAKKYNFDPKAIPGS